MNSATACAADLAGKGQQHSDVHYPLLVRIFERSPIPGFEELCTTHVQMKSCREIEKLSSFLGRDFADFDVWFLCQDCHDFYPSSVGLDGVWLSYHHLVTETISYHSP